MDVTEKGRTGVSAKEIRGTSGQRFTAETKGESFSVGLYGDPPSP